MITSISKQTEPINDTSKTSNPWFRIVLMLATTTAVGLVAFPILVPMLLGTFSGSAYEVYSHITRSSAFVAYLLLWVSMLAGLSITSKTGRKWPGMAASFGVHRYTTLLGLGFAVIHALSLLGDPFMGYTIGQLLTPFQAGSYKPQWIGLGQFALYALAIVAFSFYVRNRLGMRTWRMIHSLSFALFLTALIHGLQTGSDSSSWWASGLYWISAASVLLGSVYRVLSVRAGRPRHAVTSTGLIAVAGKAQTQPSARVLQPSRHAARTPMQPIAGRVLAHD